ncbi:autotransporter assembly complex family protein [Sphingomonas bacterium]|uniref:autotransporter assembly complex protein TamA n=1 Tax=Sphingomonas bacterium TaxID=1895847 RepID=UPI0020C5F035|nr:BamA/TamA family outer membrane protein [Sphingomonas bacterium]
MAGSIGRRHYWIAVALIAGTPALGQLQKAGTAPVRGPKAPKPDAGPTPADAAPSTVDAPIVTEQQFDSAMPPLSGNINAPLEPMAPLPPATTDSKATGTPPLSVSPVGPTTAGALPPTVAEDPQLTQPLTPLAGFDTTPLETAADIKNKDAPAIRYRTEVKGLDAVKLTSQFKALSALEQGKGKAANATQINARGKEDEALAVRLLKSLGYYDATAISSIETASPPAGSSEPASLRVTLSAQPGRLYTLSSIAVNTQPTIPADLVRTALPLKVGDAIDAARIEGAEANVSLTLPQQGYPFVKVGQRDILLDDQALKATGAYVLPVETGARSSFGKLVTSGDPVFKLDHLNVFPRFDDGQLYDSRLVDDLRDALVATSLFSSVSVEPQPTDRVNPDGTQAVDLLIRQVRGPYKSLAGTAGYSTGEGFKLQGSFTNRNTFPPEGAMIYTVVAGTQEQGLSTTFKRANAGKRDRTVTLVASIDHSNYDAFNADTLTLSGRISYDSTPIWQKKFTYAYGFELVGTNESVYDFGIGNRVRRTYFIAALPGQAVFDRSNDLLNPTKGYRLKLNLSPETSVQGSISPYARTMAEGDYYFPATQALTLAGRVRVGSIDGISRDDLAPSRRYYGGGGGSVRGYGFQRLGPLDPQGNPVGGRSLNEFSLEARYRFGNFGVVPFLDGGQAYESSIPKFSSLQYGAGIGGRVYTNFGPLRFDVATPLNKRPGDGRIALYISIGQAF